MDNPRYEVEIDDTRLDCLSPLKLSVRNESLEEEDGFLFGISSFPAAPTCHGVLTSYHDFFRSFRVASES